jgi:hypothetical protein
MSSTTTTTTKSKSELDLEKKKSDEAYYGGTLGGSKGDYAKDNLWMLKDDLFTLTPKGTKPSRTMEKVDGDKLLSEGDKIEGVIVYFLPKDKSGKLVGTPKRYLHIWKGGRTNKFIDAEKVVPYYQDILNNKSKWISSGGSDLVEKAQQKLGVTSSESIASSFTALDDINSQMNNYGFNSDIDLSNMDGLDDSILNSIGKSEQQSNYVGNKGYIGNKNAPFIGQVGDKRKTVRFPEPFISPETNAPFIGQPLSKRATKFPIPQQQSNYIGYRNAPYNGGRTSNMINENLLDGLTENTSLLSADGEDEEYNMINENLLDGLTENTSLLSADGEDEESNMINENLLDGLTENTSLLSADGEDEDEEVSNAFGDWFKRNFKKTPSSDKLYKDASTLKLADPNVDIVDAADMNKAYKESGSKKPLRDWINSDSGKSIISTAAQLASLFLKGQAQASAPTTNNQDNKDNQDNQYNNNNNNNTPSETTILGMSPVTFGIVAFGLVIVSSIVAVKLFKSK